MNKDTSEVENILSHVEFISTSRGNIARQRWFAVLTNRRLLFYAIKGGGTATFEGAIKGAAVGLGVGFIIALVWPSSPGVNAADLVVRFVGLGGISAVIIGVVMGTILSAGKAESQTLPTDTHSLESILRESPEHYEFLRPNVPKYIERTPFMGGIKIYLTKYRKMKFLHEPIYSEIRLMLHTAEELVETEEVER